jgi:predicted O-methyltransferase YrrM
MSETGEVAKPMEGLTYEELVDSIVVALQEGAVLPPQRAPTPWDSFIRLSDLVHANYRVPFTTITPVMRRLLFALGFAARPATIVGVGTFVGYAFTWLLRDRADKASGPHFNFGLGLDIDGEATALATRNCQYLGHREHLRYHTEDGVTAVAALCRPIDLLFLDLDDPVTGKAGYVEVLRAALPRLRPAATVLAHDPCVERFQEDFAHYHEFVESTDAFSDVCVIPLDACGLALARVRS